MRLFGFAAALLLALAGFAAPAQAAGLATDPDTYDQGFYSDPAGAITAARKQVAGGDLQGAIKNLVRYVSAHPRELEPARYLGDLYYRIPDFRAAERQYLSILLLFPNDRETHNRLGGVYAAEDRLSDAIAEFQRSLPEEGGIESLVRLHRQRGDLAQFENDYRRRAGEHPSDAGAQHQFGKVLLAERTKPHEALAQFEKVLALGPGDKVLYNDIGYAYLDANDPRRAIDALRRALALDQNYYSALVNTGEAYIELRDVATAKTYLNKAHAALPDGHEALVDLGYIEDLGQRWREAIALYQEAVAVNPLARDAYVNLGYDYREHGLFSLAEAALLKGLSVSPADAWLHYLLANVYSDQGKATLFRSEMEQAAKSDDPVVGPVARRDLARLGKAT